MFVKRLLSAILAALLVTAAYAHPGRTDARGGHYDRATGAYHYHHGYPAHQHYNGQCPYAFDDRTGYNSGTASGSSSADASAPEKMPVLSAHRRGSSSKSSDTGKSARSTLPVRQSSWWDFMREELRSVVSSSNFWVGLLQIVVAFGIPVLVYEWTMRSRRRKAAASAPALLPSRHKLDTTDTVSVSYHGREVTLYRLPAESILRVGYLRDTEELFLQSADGGHIDVFHGVPLALCSRLVRSDDPDRIFLQDILLCCSSSPLK